MRKIDPERVEAKRRQILDAAIDCFARDGFHATSTAAICKAAGMSPGNLFHYFPTKASIIEAVAQDDQREMAELFARHADADDALAAIEEIALTLMELSSDPVYARICVETAAEATRNPDVAALFAANEAQVKGRMVALIKRGVAQGKIDASKPEARSCRDVAARARGRRGRARGVRAGVQAARAPGDVADDHSADVEAAVRIADPV
ncbi:TetR/AcrR family transcriptional regulator [Burkholderia cepacia]|uniref:TetR/AcrR family transcriptional regulator n=1 Tax=Burkholderia cepacia TaxID=292 RepID=UPI001CF56079|nr:TetR/AcrR family transcriptional regulator [Burkholderia cepacia]MCA8161749.1 TetR/AcrR family transcriptional regulator [Burkholderia cepacia]